VLELDGDPGSVGVDAPGDLTQAGQEGVVGDGHLVRIAGAGRPGDGADTHDEHARAAPSALLVVADDALAQMPVGLGEVRAHRRHHDAVAQLEGPDASGAHQVGGS
jgi:hypothetical protein